MRECVEHIDWEAVKKSEEGERDCGNCGWFKNGVCKTILPCLSEKLQRLSDRIDDIIIKQIELENQTEYIIKGLQGRAEAEYQKNGGGM